MAFARALWIVLPVRGEAAGKSRLASVLAPAERMRLNRELLHRTLSVIETWQGSLQRCIVVSPCARSLAHAHACGAIALREPMPRRGLNRAARLGMALARQHGARRVLILPADLARLSQDALRRLERRAREARAVIVSDRAGNGTNALLLPAVGRFDFAFGLDSFAAHVQRLRMRGWDVAIHDDPRLRFDLDTPAELTALAGSWMRGAHGGRMV